MVKFGCTVLFNPFTPRVSYGNIKVIPTSGRQGGRVVRVLDFESVGPGFESHYEHFMDLFHGSPKL